MKNKTKHREIESSRSTNEHIVSVKNTREKVLIKELINFDGSEVPKVSVVVPVCNVEAYLRECLDSLIDQTLKEIEIICVNDGSNDNSLQILKEYSEFDKRVKIIDKVNAGYGHTMNIGMDMASGEYIGIVESDDVIEPNMFETLYNCAINNKLDWVKSDFYRYMHDQEGLAKLERVNLCRDPLFYNNVFTPNEKPECYDFTMHTWCGIYKRSFIEQNNIRHNETPGASFQDTGFFFQTFAWAKRAMFINQAFYWYRSDNPNSSVKSKTKVFCIKEEYEFIEKFINSDPTIKKIVTPYYWVVRCGSYLRTYKRIALKFKKEFLMHFREVFSNAQSRGELHPELFPTARWNELLQVLKLPNKYYYLDKIATKNRSKGKIGFFAKITMPFRRVVWCIQDNGIKFTIDRLYSMLKEKTKAKPWSYRSSIKPHICIFGRKILKLLHTPNADMKKIQNLHNIHNSDRCFITCTGPSLKIEDLDLIKDEYSIGVNTIFLAFDKTDWRPTYYAIVDAYIAQKYGESYDMDFESFCKNDIFLNSRIKSKKSNRIHKVHIDFKNHTKNNLKKNRLYIDEDISVHVIDSFTVTNMAIMIAIFLGFKDIYIMGADCSYESDKLHFVPNPFDPQNAKKGRMRLNIVRMLNGYEAIKRYAASKGVNIYNATRGGHLEVFERVKLEDVLHKERSNAYVDFWTSVKEKSGNREVLLWGGLGDKGCVESYKRMYGKSLRRVFFTKSITDGLSSLYFPDIFGQKDKYYIVSLDSYNDKPHTDNLLKSGFTLNEDCMFFRHNPISVKGKIKNYTDEYGNKIVNCPENCSIELNGRNSTIIFDADAVIDLNYKIIVGNDSIIKIGKGSRLGGIIHCKDNSKVLIGSNCTLTKEKIFAANNSEIIIGDTVTSPTSRYDNDALDIRAQEGHKVCVGKDCMFSSYVTILAGSGHSMFNAAKRNKSESIKRNVFIGAHVWIGYGVTILNGTNVGAGSVIGAQSLVNSSFPNNCTLAGAPSKLLNINKSWSRNPDEGDINNIPIEFSRETMNSVKIKYLSEGH